MEAIETKKIRGYTIEIHQDTDAESPREFNTFGTMLCGHRRYNLGDRQIRSQADIDAVLRRKDIKSMPLFLYDHSGLTMSTSPFSCPWDSGQVGIIFCTHDEIRKEFGPQGRALVHISKKAVSSAFKLMRQEVEVYDAFLRGNVYGYVILDKKGETVDSCWGFICVDGKLDYVYEAAMENVPKEKTVLVKEQLVSALITAQDELRNFSDSNLPDQDTWNEGGSGFDAMQIIDKAIDRANGE